MSRWRLIGGMQIGEKVDRPTWCPENFELSFTGNVESGMPRYKSLTEQEAEELGELSLDVPYKRGRRLPWTDKQTMAWLKEGGPYKRSPGGRIGRRWNERHKRQAPARSASRATQDVKRRRVADALSLYI